MGIQRVPNLLRWTVLACCLPYPGDPKSAIDCFFLFGISLHPGVTGSAPHWKFRGCRVHSFPSPQELLRPASWLALLSRTFTFELARRGRPKSASNMTTWINSQFPRPDFHRQVQRHYGLQDTGIPCRVGKGRPAGSSELRVSPSPSKIPYGGFSPVRLQMDRQWRPSTRSQGLSAVHMRPMTSSYTPPQFSLPGIRDPRRDYPF